MPDREGAAWLWEGSGAAARLARGALAPAELLYRAAMATRGALYDARLLRSYDTALPALSVGNLSVGGTGKTPVAAWVAGELVERGAHPAIVLRGYGADEPLVHQRLHPRLPVVTDPDRVAGIARAAAAGADVAVLDDAFQHRRARRIADVVLVSADVWTRRRRLLPAGPWREPLSALGRASLVLVTRKAAPSALAEEVEEAVRRAAPSVATARAHLALRSLVRTDDVDLQPLAALAGRRVLGVAAVGDPAAFRRQLETAGATVRLRVFDDHHAYTATEAAALAASVEADEMPVCTLKDAVKLGPLWPRFAPPLWYVSQHVTVESGGGALHALFDAVLRARGAQARDARPTQP